jgi:hypothetical protein
MYVKVIVERWRQGSEDDFWREFSTDSGQRLMYTAIIDRLAQARKEDDNEMASRAKQEYGDEFPKVFCYKKNGACLVKVKACDIAKLGLPKFGSVRFFKDFAEPRTGLQVRFGKSAEL